MIKKSLLAPSIGLHADVFLHMHRLFKRLQQRNRFVDVEPLSALNLAEAHMLKECVTQPEFTQIDYQRLFYLPQSHISRLIDRLVDRGFITKVSAPQDSRATHIRLTKAGQRVVALSDQSTRASYEELSKFLTRSEKTELVRFFKEIADGFGHPAAKLRPSELEYSLHQRRITRCFRLLGKKVFGSNFNSTQWQLLSCLSDSPTPLAASLIAHKIGITNGAATSVIKDLLKRNLVLAVTNRIDKRALSISITKQGKEAILHVEQNAAEELRHALRKHSAKQIKEWHTLLNKYVVESDQNIAIPSLAASLVVYADNQDRIHARAQIISALVKQGQQNSCPCSIVAADNLVLGFQRESEILALFDFENSARALNLTAGFFSSDLNNSQRQQIVTTLVSYIAKEKPGQALNCDFEPLSSYFS